MGSCMLYCVCFYTIVIWLRGMVTCHVILYQVVPSLIALCFITAFYLTLPCLRLHTIFNHSISYHVSWGTVPCYSKFTLQFYIVPRGTNLQQLVNLLVYVMQNVLHVFCLIPYCLRLFCFITSASLHCVLQSCSGCIMLHRKCCITVFWFFNIVYDCIVQYAMQNILYCTAFRCIMFYCTI